MTRRDEHVNAMLRHLGAAYYDSLHGRASRKHRANRDPLGHQVRWRQRVRDVMTTKVDVIEKIAAPAPS